MNVLENMNEILSQDDSFEKKRDLLGFLLFKELHEVDFSQKKKD